ncbi:cobalt transporter CbiM [Selenihalanaerobacter shriftii]|uniref:Cobalt/nickel transport system permease protein n=1 Tax=Selenihalanaerobacter shriftii TaxID=142842 RepID=A0A1T4K0H9_9FIRM|nr:cobalt transporter CbiM [Selenihalanaerobacter shriftii]SJZ35931.1 cobalt/nickel transport system permease protein [Selenihalanaerobacter shriftii]
MHISEGVLSAPVLISGGAVTLAGMTIGLKQIKDKDIPKTAIVSAALFVASLIHVPVGPTNIHLILNGIAGILLGWRVFPAFFIAFFLQGILFQFGGITTLGVNVVIMALPAVICYYLFKILLKISNEDNLVSLGIISFICGALAVVLAALLMAVSLIFTEESFLTMTKMAIISESPLMIIEGIVSAFCLIFIKKVKPEILRG